MRIKIKYILSHRRRITFAGILFYALVASGVSGKDSSIRVTFVNPDKPGNAFWDKVTQNLHHAAEDLNVDLQVLYAENRFHVPDVVQNAIETGRKPDYLIYIYQYAQSLDVLKLAEEAKIKSFLFNTNMTPMERESIGYPRQRFKYWIGHSYPNNTTSGRELAAALFKTAKQNQIQHDDGKQYVIALHGTRDSSVAADYRSGLEHAVSVTPNVKIQQQLYSNWSYERARKQVEGVLRRHPEVNIIWAGSEDMALGAIDACEQLHRKPGKDILIGGTASSVAGIKAIQHGKLIANMGGDTLEAAWVLTKIYDYHHGLDFFSDEKSLSYSTKVVTQKNLSDFSIFYRANFWKNIDFKLFSKVHNPTIKDIQVSPETVLQLARDISLATPTPAN